MSTFSTFSSRSASLMATSAFDWLSPSTCTILYLPSTPPFSLMRSIIILAPRQQLSEPGRRERARVIEQDADLDGLALAPALQGNECAEQQGGRRTPAPSTAVAISSGDASWARKWALR
jgi:hypothetical protein